MLIARLADDGETVLCGNEEHGRYVCDGQLAIRFAEPSDRVYVHDKYINRDGGFRWTLILQHHFLALTP